MRFACAKELLCGFCAMLSLGSSAVCEKIARNLYVVIVVLSTVKLRHRRSRSPAFEGLILPLDRGQYDAEVRLM